MTRTLNSEFDLMRLAPCDEELIIAFMPSNRDIYRILQTCHKLKTVRIHPDTLKEMPCVGQTLLYMQKVEISVDDGVPKSPSRGSGYTSQKKDETPAEAHHSGVMIIAR
ncbi:DUF1699 family protein [Methanotrichaceae archaeon M04Ac]|uniref:DUF1699 family protein n=1 Tax=Candidatus Methanocrinis alkalitolerans TaxID=3033395 RepID=A0ABT5XCL1_9EURY|nr:DUF1699 family protein [Candidatus Methanocrinis alkalitolerans]MCR3884287.1 DUF1699 family protein [Methanothrix sp.]MDF0592287.1 DUF1699 family protein [Candidatus Methanocrinis alkalitolerans]